MKTLTSAPTTYAAGYAEGRHAAKEHVPGYANPYPRNTAAFQGWIDGHYDEHSVRRVQIQQTSSAIWGNER